MKYFIVIIMFLLAGNISADNKDLLKLTELKIELVNLKIKLNLIQLKIDLNDQDAINKLSYNTTYLKQLKELKSKLKKAIKLQDQINSSLKKLSDMKSQLEKLQSEIKPEL